MSLLFELKRASIDISANGMRTHLTPFDLAFQADAETASTVLAFRAVKLAVYDHLHDLLVVFVSEH